MNMDIEKLPTAGRLYGSGEAITELHALIDSVMQYEKGRCDCDSHSRCIECRLESEIRFKKEALKKRMSELIDNMEKSTV